MGEIQNGVSSIMRFSGRARPYVGGKGSLRQTKSKERLHIVNV
jgi:hypothetical protein